MFGFEKNENEQEEVEILYAPVSGKIFKIEESPVSIFSRKIMGDGFAIESACSKIFAPVSGTVTLTQGQTIGLIREDGLEVLFHISFSDAEFSSRQYNFTVEVGDFVNGGEEIGRVDIAVDGPADLIKTAMIVFTNTLDKLADFTVDYADKIGGAKIGIASVKK
ncbi:PTS glucose transporter subunit IIA [Lactovum odontotermitis]